MKKLFLCLGALFSMGHFAVAQLAPAGEVLIQNGNQNYYFKAEGTFQYSTTFIYIDYSTGEFASANPTINGNGSFSGTSSTGKALSGVVSQSSISLTYNGVQVSAPKLSSYGATRALAGEWAGLFINPTTGVGFGAARVTSQGQVVVLDAGQFFVDAGVGSVDSSGNFNATLLSGISVSGSLLPSFGRIIGNLFLSNGQTDNIALLRTVPSRLLNISTRGFVGSGEQVLIGGFIIGDGGKTVFIDAKGPSLASQGVSDPVQATQISLYLGSQLIASNNGWRNNGNVGELIASGLAPGDDRESALQVALEPGAYTAVVSSGDGSTGIGIVEVFGVGDTEGP